jgi:penicillin-binding protein 1A
MKTALKAVPNDQLVQPEGIVSILIDKDTGKATSGHKNSMFEYFRKEFVPKPPEIAAQNEIIEGGETEEIIEDELF